MRSKFLGFTRDDFRSCETGTKRIDQARERLQHLRVVLEPKMETLNESLHGIVSRPKRRRSNHYNDWAWLMFTNARIARTGPWAGKPIGAYQLTQLVVNMSRRHLYAGLFIKQQADSKKLRNRLQAEENLLDKIARAMGSREWIIGNDEDVWDKADFRYHDQRELRVFLLDPKTDWINARWSASDPIVSTSGIVNEVFSVFRTLYPLYTLALNFETPPIPGSNRKPWTPPTVHNKDSGRILTDADTERAVDSFVRSLQIGAPMTEFHVEGGRETYPVRRLFVPLNPQPYHYATSDGLQRTVYLDTGSHQQSASTPQSFRPHRTSH